MTEGCQDKRTGRREKHLNVCCCGKCKVSSTSQSCAARTSHSNARLFKIVFHLLAAIRQGSALTKLHLPRLRPRFFEVCTGWLQMHRADMCARIVPRATISTAARND